MTATWIYRAWLWKPQLLPQNQRKDLMERILCAAVYVDTGKQESPHQSCAYPKTGLVFPGWRHNDCLILMEIWAAHLSDEERKVVEDIDEDALHGKNQGFLTSIGRFVDRDEALMIATFAGQASKNGGSLDSDDLY